MTRLPPPSQSGFHFWINTLSAAIALAYFVFSPIYCLSLRSFFVFCTMLRYNRYPLRADLPSYSSGFIIRTLQLCAWRLSNTLPPRGLTLQCPGVCSESFEFAVSCNTANFMEIKSFCGFETRRSYVSKSQSPLTDTPERTTSYKLERPCMSALRNRSSG